MVTWRGRENHYISSVLVERERESLCSLVSIEIVEIKFAQSVLEIEQTVRDKGVYEAHTHAHMPCPPAWQAWSSLLFRY